ncbi:MAG: ATP-dependent DNA helicase RecQ [archaeon GW2011_AR13]|nr:MAG: ATP-dependent DNA helicase RecQ [archaeon GW2011_AR13]HIG93997.1 RecQ family ATP-dependent DNA helicase [Nanoarchaeota archaeon]HIH63811.1 RecQ family ATP-dependent DNA helicase [Nanoarchaeota archaeon]HIJ09124.1 RecQ family ATP-dependent DNA helicase [Nanoarchaeota archaeon]
MKEVLKRYFGYDEFRYPQEEIIKSVLEKKDVFAILPTGGGKSLCYQIPALKLKGITLVISPLIALMKDQVDNLKSKGIPAEFINSSLAIDELAEIQFRILTGEIKMLYIAPERLALESFRNFLKSANISLIAIDEAHCISEWGHDFRPSYRELKNLRETFPNISIIALTATATPKIQNDICKQLSLIDPKIFISSFDRKNLSFIIIKKRDAFPKLVDLLRKHEEGSSIIYCFSRNEVEKISGKLNAKGFNVLAYHAGLNSNIRKFHQEQFIQNKVKIVVATIAFGMGIDKPDVRLVVHYSFPKTMEGYYQEIGRAGRDGLESDCVLFYSKSDLYKHEFFIDKIDDEQMKENAKKKLDVVIGYCNTNKCRRRFLLNYFGEKFLEDNCKGCDNCLNSPKFENPF